MRALVTGGTGLIGRALVKRLVASGHEVACMLRHPVVPATNAITIFHGDLLEPCAISFESVGSIDVIFHLGALLPTKDAPDAAYMTANAAGTAAVVEAGLRQGVPRFVYLSSISVYGGAADDLIHIDTPLSPQSAYATSKLCGELCMALARRRGAAATSLRLSSVYGPDMNAHSVLPRFIDAALAGEPFGWLGTGSRAQDFIHVDDVAEACLAAGRTDRSGDYILASGVTTNMRTLAEGVAAGVAGAKAQRMGEHDAEDGRIWAFDVRPTQEAFGFPSRRHVVDDLHELIRARQSTAQGCGWWKADCVSP